MSVSLALGSPSGRVNWSQSKCYTGWSQVQGCQRSEQINSCRWHGFGMRMPERQNGQIYRGEIGM